MDTYHRREALLNWLRSRSTATASEAADKFGVSTRTVLRDIAALRERGEPIESDAGRGGGLRVDVLRSLPPVRVRLEDVVGLYLWYHLTRLAQAAPASANAEPAVEKMMGVLPPSRAGEIRRTLRRVVVRPPTDSAFETPTLGAPDILSLIERSINLRRGLDMDVESAPGAIEQQRAEIHGILIEGTSWYLIAVQADKRRTTLIRIDQIVRARLVDDIRYSHYGLEELLRRATRPSALPVAAEGGLRLAT